MNPFLGLGYSAPIRTCVIITDYEDVRGYLSADGDTIDWEDGDCWRRVAGPKAEQCEAWEGFRVLEPEFPQPTAPLDLLPYRLSLRNSRPLPSGSPGSGRPEDGEPQRSSFWDQMGLRAGEGFRHSAPERSCAKPQCPMYSYPPYLYLPKPATSFNPEPFPILHPLSPPHPSNPLPSAS